MNDAVNDATRDAVNGPEKQQPRTCVITGTTHGIGFEAAKLIAKRGHTVVMLNRNTQRAELVQDHIRKLSGNVEVFNIHCDLASLASIRQCAQTLRAAHSAIDVLVNNAGIMSGKPQRSADGIELTFAVNHLAPFLLTELLKDMLLQSPQGRVVNLASAIHTLVRSDITRLGSTQRYKSMRVYAESKLANVMHTLQLAERHQDSNMTANCMHPGVVATNLLPADRPILRWGGKLVRKFMRSPAEGAATVTYLALSPDLNTLTGKYFAPNKRIVEPGKLAKDPNLQRQLWDASMQLAGLT